MAWWRKDLLKKKKKMKIVVIIQHNELSSNIYYDWMVLYDKWRSIRKKITNYLRTKEEKYQITTVLDGLVRF